MPDIFISYAHRDNNPIDPNAGHWVDDFERGLRDKFADLLGTNDVDLYRDPKTDGVFRPLNVIDAALKQTKFLIVISTPRWHSTDECRHELEEFLRIHGNPSRIPDSTKQRVLKIGKSPVDRNKQVPSIADLYSHDFFTYDPVSGRHHELDRLGAHRHKFQEIISEVAQDLYSASEDFDSARSNYWKGFAPSVFVAECTEDARNLQAKLVKELETKYSVVPERSRFKYSQQKEEFLSQTNQLLQDCSLSLHVLGQNYGRSMVDDERSATQLQIEAAGEIASKEGGVRRVIWLPKSTVPTDPRQEKFIEKVKTTCSDFYVASADEIEHHVREITQAGNSMIQSSAKTESSTYLVYEQRDKVEAEELAVALSGQRKIEMPKAVGSLDEIYQHHKSKLMTADTLLIYWGSVGQPWVEEKLQDIFRIKGFGRKDHLPCCVFLGPQQEEQKTRFKSDAAMILKEINDLLSWVSRVKEL
ncbi:MAG: hypothetical protein WCT03_03285 [Candidatus Obscuribacterales bacterium]|jgi:hypothetical protein